MTLTPIAPFARRVIPLGQRQAHVAAGALDPKAVVHKWTLHRRLTECRAKLGVSDRALVVLHALLTFHPETALSAGKPGDLVVFPSNVELSLRAHGMSEPTLRRHIAALVDAGLVARRDSPNGKRYAVKGDGGAIDRAFGFDLAPFAARAAEIERLAAEVAVEAREIRRLRETVTITRREISLSLITLAELGVPGDELAELESQARALSIPLPRSAGAATLAPICARLSDLLARLTLRASKAFTAKEFSEETSGNAADSERQYQNSKSDNLDLEPLSKKAGELGGASLERSKATYPIGFILSACPGIADYAPGGTLNRQSDLLRAAEVARSALGISPSAWAEAKEVIGDAAAAIVIAVLLEKGDAVAKPGGYLRSLTEKARAGGFSVGPMLMSQARARGPTPKRA